MLNNPKSQILGAEPVFVAQNARQARRLGSLLLQKGLITLQQLEKALACQRNEDARLGEILMAQGWISKSILLDTLAEQMGIPRAPLVFAKPSAEISKICTPADMIALSFVPFSLINRHVAIAFSDPTMREEIETYFWKQNLVPRLYLADRDRIQSQIMKLEGQNLSCEAETICPINLSCRQIGLRISIFVTVSAALLGAFIAQWFHILPQTMLVFGIIIFLSLAGLKFSTLITYFFAPRSAPTNKRTVCRQEKVTLLVPLYKETKIAQRLIPRLKRLDYPKELLEVLFICEEQDLETQNALLKQNLPHGFRKIIVPKGAFKTKPRALNYALAFASGSIIGIYDAEDAPEVDQVSKAVHHLQTADLRVACVQARLDFYNAQKNWLARCFALEYNILFRIFLPGLAKLDLPIPLGGTSIFIKREVLKEIGQWDAHNVTEDADLGMRLYRHGYRVECLDSTTYEEANHRTFSWIKQRSRWLKGFFLTWASHMQNPFLLFKDVGVRGLFAINLLFFATVLNYLILPLFLPLWLLYFGWVMPEAIGIPTSLAALLFLLLIFGEPYYFIAGFLATKQRRLRKLRPYLLTLPLYWPLASIAAFKAILEAVFAPYFWDKTEHGLDDAHLGQQIGALTRQNRQN
ncbi:MAG: glycosyltransferase family 2 protein [Pseudomonadota bacterium]